jgi:adenine-specific DNA-methyltransferase
MPLTSVDVTAERLEKLKELFPEAFTEGKVDFERLRQALGDVVDTGRERYGLSWAGKADAIRAVQTPSVGTLIPVPEESVSFETTENVFIEGENLEVLKLLQKSYHGKVKMIYIDPPYNTGNEFIYPDDYRDPLKQYLRVTGQVSEKGVRLTTNTEISGRYHSNWLSMMYPRLFLARNLLQDDGVIFISIDDNELSNLLSLVDEVFGEENRVAILVWEKKKKGSFLSKTITNVKEYIVVVAKRKDAGFAGLIGQIISSPETYPCINASNSREIRRIPPGIASRYREPDVTLEKGAIISVGTMNMVLHSDLVISSNRLSQELLIEGNWRYSQELMEEYARHGELYITQDLYLRRIVTEPRMKMLKDLLPRVGEGGKAGSRIESVQNLLADGWGTNEDGNEELRLLMGVQNLYDYPKPTKLLAKLIASTGDKNALVLDFFAGSGSAADAVLQLNRLDNGNRRFVMVQLQEPAPQDSAAYAAGYKTVSQIGLERCRRAIRGLSEQRSSLEFTARQNPEDLGMRAFQLASSNFKIWEGQKAPQDAKGLAEQLKLYADHVLEERSKQDILYELVLKAGLPLTAKIEEKSVTSKTVYSVADGLFLICLEDEVTAGLLRGMTELKPQQVICLDRAFRGNDQLKTNTVLEMKQRKITFHTV